MSPRAAWRLERLGFFPVYDYTAGKADWTAAGLPTERRPDAPARAVDVADRDVPTCGPEDTVGRARKAAEAAGRPSVIVVNEERIVLGRLRPRELEGDGGAKAEDVMEPGPATVRAHEEVDALVERMRKRGVHEAVVTTPAGELLGVVRDESTS
jgi:CBS domain-containing protein